jgi:hypothetical protein
MTPMKKTALILIALAVLTGSAFAGTYRVTYTFRGLETSVGRLTDCILSELC